MVQGVTVSSIASWRRKTLAFWLGVAWLGTTSAAPVSAEVLVTQAGDTIEIRGPHEVRGKQVVFTMANGALASLRATEVDFEATARANAPASEAAVPEPEAPPPAPPVLVLRDGDLPAHQAPPPSQAETAPGDQAAETEGEGDSTEPDAPSVFSALGDGLRVERWVVEDRVDGIEIVGTLINDSGLVAVELGVRASVFAEGTERTFEGFVDQDTLPSGRRAAFRVPLLDVLTAPDEPRFEVRGRGVRPKVFDVVDPSTDEFESETATDDTSGSPRDRRL